MIDLKSGESEPLRVHVAGLGPREVDRVCGAVESLRGDRLVVLGHAPDDDAALAREKVRERFEDSLVDLEVVFLGPGGGDPVVVARYLYQRVKAEEHHNWRFNVSTGPRAYALGAFMAAQFTPLRLYESHVDEARPPDDPRFDQHPFARTSPVLAFRNPEPRGKALDALESLVSLGGTASQAAWIEALGKSRIIRPQNVEKLSAQAKQAQFRVISDTLEELGFIDRPSGRSRFFRVTSEGRAGLRFFRGDAAGLAADERRRR